MAGRPRVLIVGGYGVFGRLLARELLETTGSDLVLAGRRGDAAASACAALAAGDRVSPLALDLEDLDSFRRAVQGCFAVACTAGPFQMLSTRLPFEAVSAGVHWVDIGDPARWVLGLLDDAQLNAQAVERGVAVVPGASTSPAVSGVLARLSLAACSAADRVRVTLLLGNRNAKSGSAIATALSSGFASPERVDTPLGWRQAYEIDTADPLLLEREVRVRGDFRVSFEWKTLNALVSAAQPLGRSLGARSRLRVSRVIAAASRPLSKMGTDRSWLIAEALDAGRPISRVAVTSRGQSLAILPCAIVVRRLLQPTVSARGCQSPATILSPEGWLQALVARGVQRIEAS